jgi:hypothetical protein
MAGKIFINYRRGDDPGNTGRLFDRLQEAFQPEQLFIDVDSIAPGLDFVRVLEEQVGQCDALLAVIGKGWVDARDDTGARRLDNPEDFVRIEIESSLKQDKRVIPVLVGDAHMPRPEELPEAIRPLARRNAVRLSHERFRADAQGLIKALQRALEEVDALRQAHAEAARKARAEEERKREEEAANERAKAQREAEEQARREKEQARLTAIAGLSAEQIGKAEELANWDFIKASESAQDFSDHLARFPNGVTERMARAKLESLMWAGLSARPDLPGLRSFLNEFPDGKRAADAKVQLADLERQAAAAREEEERRRQEKLQEEARQRVEQERQRHAEAPTGETKKVALLQINFAKGNALRFAISIALGLAVGGITYEVIRQNMREPLSAQQSARVNPLDKRALEQPLSSQQSARVNPLDKRALEQAADKGDVRAMMDLGSMHVWGLGGVAEDWAKAREWWEKAATKGDAEAMKNLGWSYEKGLAGVAQDYAKAREWYEKAAAKGNDDAKLRLEELRTKQPAGKPAEPEKQEP